MRGLWCLWLLACGGGPVVERSSEVASERHDHRKGPFSGDFDQLERTEAVGSEVVVTLAVQADEDLPGGSVRLAAPRGLTVVEGPVERSLAAWRAGERRTFSWRVRVDVPEQVTLLAKVDTTVPGEIASRSFAVVFNPVEEPDRVVIDPAGNARHVEVLDRR